MPDSTPTDQQPQEKHSVRCAKCGRQNPDDRSRCAQCGASLYVVCLHCGRSNARTERSCGKCGRTLRISRWERFKKGILGKKPQLRLLQIALFVLFTLAAFLIVVYTQAPSAPPQEVSGE